MVVLEDDLERTSKYIKKWAKRFVSFDDVSRKISYGMEKDKIKSTITVTKITRLAEIQPLRANSSDLHVVHIEGTSDDGKTDTWTIRIPEEAKFNLWYKTIRNCLASQGQMDPLSFGLPDEDPRNGLPFVSIGLEYLHKFALLEKAIVYYFGPVSMHGYETGLGGAEHIVMVGDRNLYVFRPNADVLRCVPIEQITSLKSPENPTNPNAFAVIGAQPVEHDIALKATPDLEKIITLIAEVYKGIKNASIAVQKVVPTPSPTLTIDQWCEANDVRLRPLEGYKMKAVSPTPKSKLKVALDLYKQQHGSAYSRTATKRSKTSAGGEAAGSSSSSSPQAGPSSASGGAGSATAQTDVIDDSLSRMLKRLNLMQYSAALRKQHVDVELLTCMDATDLVNFGVKDPQHCEAILKASAEREANGSPTDPAIAPATTNAAPAGLDLARDIVASSAGGSLGAPPTITPQPNATPQSPLAASSTKKMMIVLDSDDDEDLLPIMSPAGGGGVTNSSIAFNSSMASPGSPTGADRPAVILDDSDDDLVVMPPKPAAAATAPAPKPAINLDDDDDI